MFTEMPYTIEDLTSQQKISWTPDPSKHYFDQLTEALETLLDSWKVTVVGGRFALAYPFLRGYENITIVDDQGNKWTLWREDKQAYIKMRK